MENRWDKLKINSKRVDLNPVVSIITLNISGLNTTIKRWSV